MPQGGDTTSPVVLFPASLDHLVIGARALPIEYAADDADRLEDGAAEWIEEDHLRLIERFEPHRRQLVLRVHAARRRGDANTDRVVLTSGASLTEDAERSRSLGGDLLAWCRERAGVVSRTFTVVAAVKPKATKREGVAA